MSSSATPPLVVHYHRIDGAHARASLWIWDWDGSLNPPEQSFDHAETDDFGAVYRIPLGGFGGGVPCALGILPRLDRNWDRKDAPERKWTPDMPREVWLIEGEAEVFTAPPDLSPRIRLAFLDHERTVSVFFSKPHGAAAHPPAKEAIRLVGPDGSVPIAFERLHVTGECSMRIDFVSPMPVNGSRWRLEYPNFKPCAVVPRGVFLDPGNPFVSADPMGARHTPERTVFRLFAPSSPHVALALYEKSHGPSAREELPMERRDTGVWECAVEGDLAGRHYMFVVEDMRTGRRNECADPWAFNRTGRNGRPRIANLRGTDPAGFRPIERPPFSGLATDAVVTELHVRDFSIHENGGMKNRGKYLAFAEEGTHLRKRDDVSTGLAHLAEMGFTHVQFLPLHDFDNNEDREDYNWGYMTSCFLSPEGWYASSPFDDSRLRELKTAVAALHRAGLRVVMDVVYNHTAADADFERIVPGYYLRCREDGTLHNGSGTGNEFRSEAPMARRLIVDSLKYWVEEFGVDGFRFDLLGLTDLETVRAIGDELLAVEPTLLLYGEPWSAGPGGIPRVTDKWALRDTVFAAFNDHYRNALKGAPDGAEIGYVQGAPTRDAVLKGLAGSIDDWAHNPVDTINYADCHDNLTLWDKIVVSTPQETEAEHIRMYNLTLAILALSQGLLFLHGGHELARTKQGHHNTYDMPDSVNRLDWSRKLRYRSIFDFTRSMIALRRAHPVLRLATAEEVRRRFRPGDYHPRSPQLISAHLDGRGLPGESWGEVMLLLNPYPTPRQFHLPEGTWDVFVSNHTVSLEPFATARKSYTVQGRAVAVLAKAEL